jgi:hypothetical protein
MTVDTPPLDSADHAGTESLRTLRWSEVDSNFRFRDALLSPTAWPWSRRLNDRLTTPICWWAGNCSADRPLGSVPKRLSRICRLSRPLEPSYEV